VRYLREDTAVTVVVGPFVDKSDAVTPITSLTYQSTLNGRAVSNGTGAAYTPANAGAWVHDGNGYYLAALAVADVPTVGRFRLEFSDPNTFLPVWEDFTVLSAAVYDTLFGAAALSTYAGGPVASVTAPVAVGTLPTPAPAGYGSTPEAGTTAITHAAGGTGRSPSDMTVQDSNSQPISGATVQAYLASAYGADPATALVIAETTTDVSGHWTLNLPAGAAYTLVFAHPGDQSATGSVTV